MKLSRRLSLNLVLVIVIIQPEFSGRLSAALQSQLTWFGQVVGVDDSYAYHGDHGWLFIDEPDSESLWAYSPGLGWFWTSAAIYPALYAAREGEWYAYAGKTGDIARFENLRTGLVEKEIMFHEVEDWSARLETHRATQNLPAIAMVYLQGGRIQAEGVTGTRIKGQPANRAELTDRFHVGSITKSMTAFLAAGFVEDGELEWSDRLGDLSGVSATGQNRSITFGQLLNHTSGLPGIVPDYASWFSRTDPLMDQRMEWIEMGATTSLQSSPSLAYSYSNWGYVIAGGWLETLADKPWETLISERLFDRLGLHSAGFGMPQGNAPWGHTDAGQPVNPATLGSDNARVLGPAGTVHMTVRDLARYGAMHLAGTRGEPSLLPEARFQQLHTPTGSAATRARYAYGWVVGSNPDYIWHNGSNTMNLAYLLILPDDDAVVAIVTNQGGSKADDALNAIQVEVLQHFELAKGLGW